MSKGVDGDGSSRSGPVCILQLTVLLFCSDLLTFWGGQVNELVNY